MSPCEDNKVKHRHTLIYIVLKIIIENFDQVTSFKVNDALLISPNYVRAVKGSNSIFILSNITQLLPFDPNQNLLAKTSFI